MAHIKTILWFVLAEIFLLAILVQGGPYTYARAAPQTHSEPFLATVYAYTSRPEETDDRPFETASGTTVHDGTLACPSRLDFGTKVLIKGKTYTCEDRMNKRYRDTDTFDIWHADLQEAREWGVQELQVRIEL